MKGPLSDAKALVLGAIDRRLKEVDAQG